MEHTHLLAAILIDANVNDEIIIPAHTYCATALAFVRNNAKIKWADINKDSLTVSLDSIKNLLQIKLQ